MGRHRQAGYFGRDDYSEGEFGNPRLIRVAKDKRYIRWAFRSMSEKQVDFAPDSNENGKSHRRWRHASFQGYHAGDDSSASGVFVRRV